MVYVVSDIHGNKSAFLSILKQIDFKDTDQLFVLGDVIDRKKYGIELLQMIMSMPNVHMILGNHEYMMLDALGHPYEPDGCTKDFTKKELKSQWFHNGGDVTYEAWKALSKSEKSKLIKYLKNLPIEYDIEFNDRVFKLVHAIPTDMYEAIKEYIPEESEAYFTVWERDLISYFQDVEEYVTIFGHTPTCHFNETLPMKIYKKGNTIGIDCGAAYGKKYGGRLACIRLDDMKVFYSK